MDRPQQLENVPHDMFYYKNVIQATVRYNTSILKRL
jgi:hypothetical protein